MNLRHVSMAIQKLRRKINRVRNLWTKFPTLLIFRCNLGSDAIYLWRNFRIAVSTSSRMAEFILFWKKLIGFLWKMKNLQNLNHGCYSFLLFDWSFNQRKCSKQLERYMFCGINDCLKYCQTETFKKHTYTYVSIHTHTYIYIYIYIHLNDPSSTITLLIIIFISL